MENLIREPTEKTLRVSFDAEKGEMEMEGLSYSENTREFFEPLAEWFRQYISEIGKPITLNLKLQYLNSTSAKYLVDFIGILEEFYEIGGEVLVRWYYEDGDDMEEMGEELAEDMNLPFQLFVYDD